MLAAQKTPEDSCDWVEYRIPLKGFGSAAVLATGAWLKNTVTVANADCAMVSHGVGDLDSAKACHSHETAARSMLAHLDVQPGCVAHDLHPDFHSTRFAADLAEELGVFTLGVQHHHAHIAAVCAEHGSAGPVIGLALDGIGLGVDGTAWGGELLRVEGASFQRLGHLLPLGLPGGDRAAREPWRMAASVLHATGQNASIARRFGSQAGAGTVAQMLERGINCPKTSSAGRLFDAASGLLGLKEVCTHEAEAAMLLEQQARTFGEAEPMDSGFCMSEEGALDFRPLLVALSDCKNPGYGAALFHATLSLGLVQWAGRAADQSGISTIVLGGGCFHNQILRENLAAQLSQQGFNVLQARQMPPGDSAISLGQAWVALHHLKGC